MSNEVGKKIRVLREKLGYSQEYMAVQLDLSQSSYGRLEQLDDRLTITVLKKISKILNTSVAALIEEKTANIVQQMHNETATAYNIDVNNIINNNVGAMDELKSEVAFLKELILKKI